MILYTTLNLSWASTIQLHEFILFVPISFCLLFLFLPGKSIIHFVRRWFDGSIFWIILRGHKNACTERHLLILMCQVKLYMHPNMNVMICSYNLRFVTRDKNYWQEICYKYFVNSTIISTLYHFTRVYN